jgi:hypothetical protein
MGEEKIKDIYIFEKMELLHILIDGMSLLFGADTAILLALLIVSVDTTAKVLRIREANRIRNRQAALENMDTIDEGQFKRMFRMKRSSFENLLLLLEDYFDNTDPELTKSKATNSSGSEISLRAKLAVSIRWLAGGSYLDLCFCWGIGLGTFFHTQGPLWTTLEAIDTIFEIGMPFNEMHELRRMADEFSRYSYGKLRNCVLAIDGWYVELAVLGLLKLIFLLIILTEKDFLD